MPNDRKLKQLAAVTQLTQGLQQPQIDQMRLQQQEKQANLATLIQVLNMQQQQEAQAAQLGLQKQLGEQNNELLKGRNFNDAAIAYDGPGSSPVTKQSIELMYPNQFGQAATDARAEERRQAGEVLYGHMKAVGPEKAESLRGEAVKHKNLYEEQYARAFPPQPMTTSNYVQQDKNVHMGDRAAMDQLMQMLQPQAQPAPQVQATAPQQPYSPTQTPNTDVPDLSQFQRVAPSIQFPRPNDYRQAGDVASYFDDLLRVLMGGTAQGPRPYTNR